VNCKPKYTFCNYTFSGCKRWYCWCTKNWN